MSSSTNIIQDITSTTQYEFGTNGYDVFRINDHAGNYGLAPTSDGGIVVWNKTTNAFDILYNVESVQFDDKKFEFKGGQIEECLCSQGNPMPAPVEPVPAMQNIVEIAAGSPDFSILVAALNATNLADTVKAASDITVFAPTNAAFAQLAVDLGFTGNASDNDAVFNFIVEAATQLGNGDPIPVISNILKYHVSPGAKSAQQVDALDKVETLLDGATFGSEGKELVDNEPDVANPNIVKADIMASNGKIQVLDRVLLPLDIPGNGANTPPEAADDSFNVVVDETTKVDVLSNDKDGDGDTLTITQINGIDMQAGWSTWVEGTGLVTVNGDGTLDIKAHGSGPYSFEYTVCDGNGGTSTAMVKGECEEPHTPQPPVAPANTPPEAVHDKVSGQLGETLSVNVLANDSDADGDSLSVTQINGIDMQPGWVTWVEGVGLVTLKENGNVDIQPADGVTEANFSYTISDGNGGTSMADVCVEVTTPTPPQPEPPMPEPALGSLSGRFFEDKNRDDLDNDSNNSVQGVTVELLDASGNPTGRTTTTDANGNYSFTGLTPDTYGVMFTDTVSGMTLVAANQGTNDAIDSDAADMGNNQSMITGIRVEANQDTPDNDAGVETVSVPNNDPTAGMQSFTVAGAYNNGNGRDIVIDLSKKANDVDGDSLTYSLDFENSFFVDGRKAGEFGYEVKSFDSNTGRLVLNVQTERFENWHKDAREVSSFFGSNKTEFKFTVTDEHGASAQSSFKLYVYDRAPGSPITVDINGTGEIEVTGETSSINKDDDAELGRTVKFDIDADGKKDIIEWFEGSGDGILVDTAKIAEDGAIDGSALFGDEGGKYANGYEKLKQHDDNADGLISGDELNDLGLWIDDGDAVLEEGELKSAAEAGVTSVSTEMEIVKDAEGRDLMRSEAEVNGETVMTEDVWFAKAREEAEAEIEADQATFNQTDEEMVG